MATLLGILLARVLISSSLSGICTGAMLHHPHLGLPSLPEFRIICVGNFFQEVYAAALTESSTLFTWTGHHICGRILTYSGQSASQNRTATLGSMGHGQATAQRRRAAACTQMRCSSNKITPASTCYLVLVLEMVAHELVLKISKDLENQDLTYWSELKKVRV